MTDLACVFCGKPAYTIHKGNAVCYDHIKYQPNQDILDKGDLR